MNWHKSTIKLVDPPEDGVYRVARGDRPVFVASDWEHAGRGRFDDPIHNQGFDRQRNFRAIYCSSSLVGAFVETLQKFQPSLEILTALGAAGEEFQPITVSAGWRNRRRWSRARLRPAGRFVDVCAAETIAYLRQQQHIASVALGLGLIDIDVSAVTGSNRKLTQAISRHFYDTDLQISGLRYTSRFGTDQEFESWAAFSDRVVLDADQGVFEIPSELAAFDRALRILGLQTDPE